MNIYVIINVSIPQISQLIDQNIKTVLRTTIQQQSPCFSVFIERFHVFRNEKKKLPATHSNLLFPLE